MKIWNMHKQMRMEYPRVLEGEVPMDEKSVAMICSNTGDKDAICNKKGMAELYSSEGTGLFRLSCENRTFRRSLNSPTTQC